MKNQCANCRKETNNPKFCSRTCSAAMNNTINPKRKLKRKCDYCENVVRNNRLKTCQECHDKNTRKALELRSKIENTTIDDIIANGGTSADIDYHKRLLRGYCRNWYKNLMKLPCHNCGYDKHVELCHIKSVSSFPSSARVIEINAPDNIVQLCPNCHWQFDRGNLKLNKDSYQKLKESLIPNVNTPDI